MNLQPRSPRPEARIAGVLYLLNLLTGVAAMVLMSRKLQSTRDAMNLVASVLSCRYATAVASFTTR